MILTMHKEEERGIKVNFSEYLTGNLLLRCVQAIRLLNIYMDFYDHIENTIVNIPIISRIKN